MAAIVSLWWAMALRCMCKQDAIIIPPRRPRACRRRGQEAAVSDTGDECALGGAERGTGGAGRYGVNQTEIPLGDIVRSSLALTLPWAPSTNSYLQGYAVPNKAQLLARLQGRNVRIPVTMALTDRAKTYRSDVIACIVTAIGPISSPIFTTPVRIDYEMRPPDRRRRDLSNYIKSTEDALTNAKIWTDDVLVDEFTVRRGKVITGGQIIVIITAL